MPEGMFFAQMIDQAGEVAGKVGKAIGKGAKKVKTGGGRIVKAVQSAISAAEQASLNSKELARLIAKRKDLILKNVQPAIDNLVKNGNRIKEIASKALNIEHVFSDKHIKYGLLSIGKTVEGTAEIALKTIKKADKLGLLKEGLNPIVEI